MFEPNRAHLHGIKMAPAVTCVTSPAPSDDGCPRSEPIKLDFSCKRSKAETPTLVLGGVMEQKASMMNSPPFRRIFGEIAETPEINQVQQALKGISAEM